MNDEPWRTNPNGERVVQFIKRLKLVGDWFGQPFKLFPFQEEFIRQLYGTIDPTTNKRKYKSALYLLPRKCSKSTLASALLLSHILVEPKSSQQAYSIAGSLKQARLLFDTIKDFIFQDVYLRRLYKRNILIINEAKSTITYEPRRNSYTSCASDGKLLFGTNPSLVVSDEASEYSANAKARTLWDSMRTGQGGRQEPLWITISTMTGDINNILWHEYQYALQVLKDNSFDPSYLAKIYKANEEIDDWESEEVWRKVHPGLQAGFYSIDKFREEHRRAKQLPAYENTFKRYYLNIFAPLGQQPFIPLDKWQACKATDWTEESLEGMEAYGSLDCGTTKDLSVCCLAFPWEDGFRLIYRIWIATQSALERTKNDGVPYQSFLENHHIIGTENDSQATDFDVIKRDIIELSHKYRIMKFAYDPWNATYLGMQLNDNFETEAYRQNFAMLNYPTKWLEQLVLTKRIEHLGNPCIDWQFSHCVLDFDTNENVKPSRKRSKDKIDGVYATVCALGVAASETNQPWAGPILALDKKPNDKANDKDNDKDSKP
jgi:phage terminase large subunit-like protein